MEVRVGDSTLAVRELHRFANAPVWRADVGGRWCWDVDSLWRSILDGLRIAARAGFTISTACRTSITVSQATAAAGAASTPPTAIIRTQESGGFPGLCLGYEHSFVHALAEFVQSLANPTAPRNYPDFRHALGTQYVCDAVLEAARTQRWIQVKRS